jgi:hypothetical protein
MVKLRKKEKKEEYWNIHQNHCENFQQACKSTPNSSPCPPFINSTIITDRLPTSLHPAYLDRGFTKDLSSHRNSLICLRCKTAQWRTIGLLLYLKRIQFHSFSSYGVSMAKIGRWKHTRISGVGSNEPLEVGPTRWEWKWRKTQLST